MKKVLVAMSGGVDSAVAPILLLKEGYECIGVTMILHKDKYGSQPTACGNKQDVEDAAGIAKSLGMDHYVLDLSREFDEEVVNRFIRAYEEGLTPNPCLYCNRTFKFGRLLDFADEKGCDYIATGHYARIEEREGRYLLKKGLDPGKDQSYVLYQMSQDLLKRCLFPLGSLNKAKVREIAEAHHLINADKADSQDICFVPDGDYVSFIERHENKLYPPADLIGSDGRLLGRKKPALAYTVGQRRGLGIAAQRPLYVCGKDMKKNQVYLGSNEDLMSESLIAYNWNWIIDEKEALKKTLPVEVKIRYNSKAVGAKIMPMEETSGEPYSGKLRVVFDQAQRAVAPGQAVVAYQGDILIGGGTIISGERKKK